VVLSFFKRAEKKDKFLPKSEDRLFEILLKKGFLTPSRYQEIKKESARLQKSKREILEASGVVSDEELAIAYSILYDIPIAHLPPQPVSPNILARIPYQFAIRFLLVPLGMEEGYLMVGIVDPFRITEAKEFINQFMLKHQIIPSYRIITLSDFERAEEWYQSEEEKRVVSKITLSGLDIPYYIATKIPQKVAEKYQILAFGYLPGELLKIAVVNPSDPKVIEILDFIRKRTGLRTEIYQVPAEDWQKALEVYQKSHSPKEVVAPLIETKESKEEKSKPLEKPNIVIEKVTTPEEEELADFLKKDVVDQKELQQIVKSLHVPKIVAAIVNFACQKRATDIHIQPHEKNILVRYRVDGLLRDIITIPKELLPAIISRIKILSTLKIEEQRIPQDGRFNLNFHGREVDVRVSTLPTANGEKAVLRLLDKSFGILTLEQLGLQGRGFEDLVREIEKPYGIIMATGPTGSGKSTTLYAIINRIKNPTINIVTLEDPVEYKIEGVNQSQIKPEINYTFATGLRSIVRQDPDVIMVGEIRDTETANLATHAALTGHLVLTTLHTNDSASALPRLTNMGVEPFLITSAINAIIAQRLLRRICPKCQQEVTLPQAAMAEIEKEVAKMPKGTLEKLKIKKPYSLRQGKGCPNCDNGYKGRIGIYEILVMSPSIEELAIRRRPASEILEQATKEGMLTMKQDGILKVLQGLTTYDEVLRILTVD